VPLRVQDCRGLHTDGQSIWTPEKVAKAQAAQGISVIEVQQQAGAGGPWHLVRPSRYAGRITANTPFAIGGPAAGCTLMKTSADTTGRLALGTLNNCASGMTPWGTYLSGEENWANYFVPSDQPTAHEKRWGIRKSLRRPSRKQSPPIARRTARTTDRCA
jgi:uncharacterized protein